MSGVTDDYGLILVEEGESYDEEIMNANNKAIAAQMKINALAISKLKRAEFTSTSAITFPQSNAQWGVGTLGVDANSTFNNSFIAADAPDTLKCLEIGLYYFEWTISSTTLPPNGEMAMRKSPSIQFANDDLKRTNTFNPSLTGTIYLEVNDTVTFYTFNRAGAFSGGNRIKVTKLQG